MVSRSFISRIIRYVIFTVAFLAVAYFVALVVFVVLIMQGDAIGLTNEKAVEIAREWARLAPLPKSATDIQVEVKGSSFSREFIVTFTADKKEIEKWIKESPGTINIPLIAGLNLFPGTELNALPNLNFNSVPAVKPNSDDEEVLYSITPGGGAQFAEVVIFAGGTKVRIRTYWS